MPENLTPEQEAMRDTTIGLIVCTRGSDQTLHSLKDEVNLLQTKGRCAKRGEGEYDQSRAEDFTFEDLFVVSPPDVILDLRRDVTKMEEEVQQLEKMVTPPAGVLDWDKMIEAFGVGFSIIMGFYVLYTIGATIFRSLRLMD